MKLSHFLLISAACLPQPAFAEDDEEILVSASGVERAADEVAQRVTVLDRAAIERRQTVALADLLATTPGVTVSRNGGIGAVTAVRIRGAEDAQTLVLIDGVRVNDPSAPAGAFDFGNLLAGSVERVEVLRGPGSVAWGSQAIGGVVNVVTRDGSQGFAASANAEAGAHDSVAVNGAVSGRAGIATGAVSAGYFSTRGISAAAAGSEPDGYRQFGATGRLGIDVAPGFGIDLRGYYADSRTEIDGFPAPAFLLAYTGEYSTAEEMYGYAGVRAELLGGRFRSRAAFTIADIARDNFDPALGTAPVFLGRGRSERWEYRGDLALVDQLRMVFGAEHEDSRFTDGGPVEKAGMTSAYGELILQPWPALTLTGGLRHADHARFGGHASVAASGVLALGPETRLRAAWGEGFKAPTLFQLFGFLGTPTLRPERSASWEAGGEQRLLGGRARLSATWFQRDTEDQIDFDLATFAYSNIASARTRGVELELELRPVEALSVMAGYSWLHAENRSAGANYGNDLARRPRHALSASADYRFPFGLALGATLLQVGDSFDDAGNLVRLDGYAILGVRAEMPVMERLSLYARVENLFDARYQTVAGYGTPGRAAHAGLRARLD